MLGAFCVSRFVGFPPHHYFYFILYFQEFVYKKWQQRCSRVQISSPKLRGVADSALRLPMAQVAQDWESWSLQSPSFPWEPDAVCGWDPRACLYPASSGGRPYFWPFALRPCSSGQPCQPIWAPGLLLLPEPGRMRVDEALPSGLAKGLANSTLGDIRGLDLRPVPGRTWMKAKGATEARHSDIWQLGQGNGKRGFLCPFSSQVLPPRHPAPQSCSAPWPWLLDCPCSNSILLGHLGHVEEGGPHSLRTSVMVRPPDGIQHLHLECS